MGQLRKLLIVECSTSQILNTLSMAPSCNLTHFHDSLSPLTNGCRKTSLSFFDTLRPGMSYAKSSMTITSTTKVICNQHHILNNKLMSSNTLNPSIGNPRRMFFGSMQNLHILYQALSTPNHLKDVVKRLPHWRTGSCSQHLKISILSCVHCPWSFEGHVVVIYAKCVYYPIFYHLPTFVANMRKICFSMSFHTMMESIEYISIIS